MSENSKILEINLNNDDSYNVFNGYSYIENLYIHDVKDINKFVSVVKNINIINLGFGHLSQSQSEKLNNLHPSLETFYVGHPDGFGASEIFMIEQVLYPEYIESFYDKDGNPMGEEFDPEYDDEHFQGYQDTCSISTLSFLSSYENLKQISINTNSIEVDISPVSKLKKLKKLHIRGYFRDKEMNQGNFPFLEDLSIGSISSFKPLYGLENIKKMDIQGIMIHSKEYIDFKLEGIEKFKYLEELSTDMSDLLDTSPLKKLKSLKILSISASGQENHKIDLSFLPKLKNLHTLELSDFSFKDFKFLKKLPNLKTLSISSCNWKKPLDFSDLTSLVDLEKLVMYENWFNEIVMVEDNAEEFIDVATFLKRQSGESSDEINEIKKNKKPKLKKETKIVREYSSIYKNLDQILKLQKLKYLEIVGCDNIPEYKFYKNIPQLIIKRRSYE